MRYLLLIILVLLASCSSSNPGSVQNATLPVVKLNSGYITGVYDPGGDFKGKKSVEVELVYHPWRRNNASEMIADLHRIRLAGRVPMLTIEPWPFNWNGMTKDTLFTDIVSGKYDSSILTICNALKSESPQQIFVRWGHEMEVTGEFPWSQADPQGFIKAYRHFVMTCRSVQAQNLIFMWTPAGNANAYAYWPGGDVVDMIGVSIFDHLAFDQLHGGRAHSFSEIFSLKYNLVKNYGKKVMVAELGVYADKQYQRQWIADAFASFHKYPRLVGVVYFNAVDHVEWAELGYPDWRINPDYYPPA